MSIHKWTTTTERFEIRVYGGDAVGLLEALVAINEEAALWGAEVTWETDEETIVLSFAGTTQSIGGWGK